MKATWHKEVERLSAVLSMELMRRKNQEASVSETTNQSTALPSHDVSLEEMVSALAAEVKELYSRLVDSEETISSLRMEVQELSNRLADSEETVPKEKVPEEKGSKAISGTTAKAESIFRSFKPR